MIVPDRPLTGALPLKKSDGTQNAPSRRTESNWPSRTIWCTRDTGTPSICATSATGSTATSADSWAGSLASSFTAEPHPALSPPDSSIHRVSVVRLRGPSRPTPCHSTGVHREHPDGRYLRGMEERPGAELTAVAGRAAGVLLDGRYRLGPALARGGMSTVYRATDTRLDRPVAVKVMDPRLAADPAFLARFER